MVWVEQACGTRIGAHNAYWNWVIFIADGCIYPLMLTEYVTLRYGFSAALGQFWTEKLVVRLRLRL